MREQLRKKINEENKQEKRILEPCIGNDKAYGFKKVNYYSSSKQFLHAPVYLSFSYHFPQVQDSS